MEFDQRSYGAESLTLDHADGYTTFYVAADGSGVHDSLVYTGPLGGDVEMAWRSERVAHMMRLFPSIVFAYVLARALDSDGREEQVLMRTYTRSHIAAGERS